VAKQAQNNYNFGFGISSGVVLSFFYAFLCRKGSLRSSTIRAIVNSYTSYIQIHKKGYWDDKIINNSFELNKTIESVLDRNSHITLYTPRFETFCLASSEDYTKGVMIMGVNP